MSYVVFFAIGLSLFLLYEKSQEKLIEVVIVGLEEKVYKISSTLKRIYLIFSCLPFILVAAGGITYIHSYGTGKEALIDGLKLLLMLSPMLILAIINIVFVLIINKKYFNEGEVVVYLKILDESKEILIPYNKPLPATQNITVKKGFFFGKPYYKVKS